MVVEVRYMGSAVGSGQTRKPLRRGMSKRRRTEIFLAFDRWGWDAKGWSPRTRAQYVHRAMVADAWLSQSLNVYLMWAKPDQLRTYVFSTAPTPQNRNHIRSALLGFGEFAVSQGWRPDNPALTLPRLPVPRPVPKALTIEEARRVVSVCSALAPMERALVLLYLYGGLRRNEARTLEWRQVAFNDEGAWVTVMGKGAKERSIPIHPVASDALASWRAWSNEARWVFPSPRRQDRPMGETSVWELVHHVGAMAGIPRLHPHAFRHTMATRMLETGSDIRDVQVALGHASPATTAIYAQVRPARLAEATHRLDFAESVAP